MRGANSAARACRSRATISPFWESDPDIWVQSLNVNVAGTFLMSRSVAPHLIARGWGRIINISTSLDTMQRRHNSPYGVTKAALDAASLIWAADLDNTGVTVNILLPGGMVDTDGTRPSTPQRKTLPVDVMNEAMLWLASPQSDGHPASVQTQAGGERITQRRAGSARVAQARNPAD